MDHLAPQPKYSMGTLRNTSKDLLIYFLHKYHTIAIGRKKARCFDFPRRLTFLTLCLSFELDLFDGNAPSPPASKAFTLDKG